MPHTDADPPPGRQDPSGDAPREASPLEVFPELVSLASVLADAVVVTDVHRRVAVWNDAAIALYGIDRTDAIGTVIDDLFGSTIIGEGIDSSVARGLTLEHGSWRGRVADVPRLGRRAGDELVIETVLSRLDRPDGTSVGVISVKRDITAGVRLEREIATLSSLATATGEARSRTAFAERAIEVLTTTTGAAHGAIVLAHGDAGRVLAARGLSSTMSAVTVNVPWADAPAIRAIGTVGRVLRGAVERLPLLPTTRRAFLDEGIELMVAVGLHREDELIGLLTLGWHDADAVIPSDAMWSLVATTLARGMENARLVEEIVRRADLERQTTVRLRALDDLTRVVDSATSIAELAERSARIIDEALGASGTAYGLLAADGESYATSSLVRVPPAVAEWLYANQPDVRTGFRRWRNGEGAFLEAFEPGIVSREMVEVARTTGLTGYAAIPIRVDDTLVGGVASYFDRPMADLRLDRSTLDRVATVLSASLTTFRLRERLADGERRYRTLLDSSPDALFVERLDGTILEANDAAQAIFRADGPWLIGRRPLDLAIYDDPRPRDLTRALAVGASFRVQSIGIRRDGEQFPQEVDVRRVDLDGEPRLLVRIRDLTDQERLQAELIQAQKMESTGQLVSGVAHELNNPLASILGFSQLIRRDAALPEDLRHNADLLVEEASRTRRIVQNLLDFARQRPPERYPTSIGTLVASVVALQSYSVDAGEIALEVAIDPDLPLIELDRGQLQQVLDQPDPERGLCRSRGWREPRPDRRRARALGIRRSRPGDGHGRRAWCATGERGTPVRGVLHDQAADQGHGSRPARVIRHRPLARR